ncbi:MAG: NAD(P)H-binding protein [Elusimicrobiota bacterium]|nr:NAD(P)H-binding protein [Elusimicrobiota bacterium]
MTKKIMAVTGATGHVGEAIVQRLKAAGHEVREIARSLGTLIEAVPKVTRDFTGADAAFLMLPPDPKALDPRKRANEFGVCLAEAVKASGVKRVVFLSSINAHLKEGTGPILGLRDMEERLDGLGIPQLVHLRPSYFMENHFQAVGFIARQGYYGSPLMSDTVIPMIAAADVGEVAARIMAEEPFNQPRVRELLGSEDFTMSKAARVLGAAIGKPDLKYKQLPYEAARKAMLDFRFSPGHADAMIELYRHFNASLIRGTEVRKPQNTTSTTLEQFAKTRFHSVYDIAEMAVGTARIGV